MQPRSTWIVVAVILGVVIAWLVIRPLFGGGDKKAEAAPTHQKGPGAPGGKGGPETAPPLVQIAETPEAAHPYSVILRGRTQANRTVVVRAETAGVIAATPVMQGTAVGNGTVLCRLAVDARQASLDMAKAALKSRELQMQASANLAKQGYRSQTQVLQDQANLDAASAAVRQAEVALRQVNIRAPFAGVFDHRDAEIGTYLSPGQACGTMIELNPLLIVGDIPETETANVHMGAMATARLVSGETISGRVRFVARDADPSTRTYRVEITAANPGAKVRSGLSAEVQVSSGVGPAHLVPVSSLVLDSQGRQGVRYVLADNSVAFAPVKVLEETPQGMWVSGLHGPVKIITVGQSYVSEGQRVRVAAR
jgi:multidrug efflux system membrane fusion protein